MRLAERSAGGPYGPAGSGRGGFCEDRRSWHGPDRVGSGKQSEARPRQARLELDGRSIAEGGMEAPPVVDLLDEASDGVGIVANLGRAVHGAAGARGVGKPQHSH